LITPSDAARRLPYLGALDGLRAFAVLAVLLYHLDAPWSPLHLRGGFFGVDVFFVLSGYLITSILLSEWRRSTRVSLPNFWLRRARRLLPAVGFLLSAVLLYALVVLPHEVASLRRDALASFGYVTNWYLIYHHLSYFESWGRPSLFQHLWSLAIEEQFYLVWPLLFVIGMRFLRLPGLLFALLSAAIGATVLMAVLYQPGVDPSRIYYGTDTRSAGLLIGSALALVLPIASFAERRRAWWRDALGIAGLALLAYFFVRVGDGSALPYRGGFAIVSLATAAVIAATVSSRSRLGAVLGFQPLVWIGRRSYSIYLWHWPVFMLTRPGLDVSFGGWPLFVLRLAIVAALAEVSYRFVETPIRTGAALRAWHDLRERLGTLAVRRADVALAGVALALVAVMVVALYRADAPASLSSSSSIGIDIPSGSVPDGQPQADAPPHVAAQTAPARETTPSSTPSAAAPADATALATTRCASVYTPGHRADACFSPASPTPTPGSAIAGQQVVAPPNVTAIGDSVMLGAAPQIAAALGTVDIHAKVGLQVSEGNDILRQLKAAGVLGDVVVIHLGTNGEFNGNQLAEMMEELKETKLVIFVNLKVPRDWQENNNHMLAYAVGRYPNARLIDWHAKSENEPDYFWDDRIHLRPEGALVYTGLILGEIRADWPLVARDNSP
jgi:peptidoglycan/LPS O-acetylase OafA/YrhL